MSFNASIQVTELLMKTLENAAKDMASRCVKELASKHNFNAEEAIKDLGLENLSLVRKQMAKKARGKSVTDKKSLKKERFPMPFIEELVDIAGCQGLNYNRGLFTQCEKKCMEKGNFCKGCQKESDSNASGKPNCGTVSDRLSVGLYEFKDSKGRSPTAYLKVLNKMKLTSSDALNNAGKLNVVIPSEHLSPLPEKKSVTKGTRGRPKKAQAIQADNITDLFQNLTSDNVTIEEEDETDSNDGSQTSNGSGKKAKLTDEEKAAKKAALEAERAQKKAEKEARLAQEKAEKEAKRKAEAEIKKAEKEAKIAQEKAEKEAKRAQEKAEKEAKRAQEKAEKEAEKAAKKAAKTPVVTETPVAKTPVVAETPAKTPVAETPASEVQKVKQVKIGDVIYLKTADNTLYNPQTKEPVGIWNPVTKQIDEIPEEEDDEVEEEEYDE